MMTEGWMRQEDLQLRGVFADGASAYFTAHSQPHEQDQRLGRAGKLKKFS